MFTGIVEEMGRVDVVAKGGLTISAAKVMSDLAAGGSISLNGACLTVTSRDESSFSVDVVPETLRRTNLGSLQPGDTVNLERALQAGERFDGHIVQGHVDGTGTIKSISADGQATLVTIQAPPSVTRYVVEKGFVAVDGTSLTVVNCTGDAFTFTLVPYTKENTVLGFRKAGEPVNIEVDILAKYVERLMAAGAGPRQ